MKSWVFLGLLFIHFVNSAAYGSVQFPTESHPDFDLTRLKFLKVKSPDHGYGFISVDFANQRASWWTATAAGGFEKMEFDIPTRTVTLTLGEPAVAEKELVTLVLNDDLSAIYSDANYEAGRAEYVRSRIDCDEDDLSSYYNVACGFTELDAVITMLQRLLDETPYVVNLDDSLTPGKSGGSFDFKGVGQYGIELSGNIAIGTPKPVQGIHSTTGEKRFRGYRVFWGDDASKSLVLRNSRGQVIHQTSGIAYGGPF